MTLRESGSAVGDEDLDGQRTDLVHLVPAPNLGLDARGRPSVSDPGGRIVATKKAKQDEWAKELKTKAWTEERLFAVDGGATLLVLGFRALHHARRGDKALDEVLLEGLPADTVAPTPCAASADGLVAAVDTRGAQLLLIGRDAKVAAIVHHPDLAHAQSVLVAPRGDEIVIVTDASTGAARVPARVYAAPVASLREGGALTRLAELPYRPSVAYDDTGRLCWIESGRLTVRERDDLRTTPIHTAIDRATLRGATSTTVCSLLSPAHLRVAGDRCVARDSLHGGEYFVFNRAGDVLRTFTGLLCERLALLPGGRTLVLTAARAKDRTGSADYVQWPDPRTREAYVGAFDTDSGDIRHLVERSPGYTRAFAMIDETSAAIASDVRGGGARIEIVRFGT